MIEVGEQLAPYGFTLVNGEVHNRNGKPTGVLAYIQTRNRLTRVYCRSRATNGLLFSGQSLDSFMQKFWGLEKPCAT